MKDDGSIIEVGELRANGESCGFRYYDSFRDDSSAFALDPINLPLDVATHNAENVLFGVFEDSLPDGWGRALISKRFKLSYPEQSPHLLLQYLDHKSIGALSYDNLDKKLPAEKQESINSIGELAVAARAFEKGDLQDDMMLQRLFNSAGSSGGAHPKASVLGDDGLLKLVKFPSITDKYDIVGLEAACLELARMSGIQVPEFSIMKAGGIKMLCLDRFDRTDEGCRHMISMQSLLNAAGFYHSSYVQMADVISSISKNPSGDRHALYRQMIFNAVVGNTDDHLKNFSMYYCDGFYLTPAYDLLPDVNQRQAHTLSFHHNDVGPRRLEATGSLAVRFKINQSDAEAIVDEVIEIVGSNWNSVCTQFEVPVNDTSYFKSYVERQQNKLSKQD
ncbi:MAG: type II toxin-antitoxin system HipA family toxin [Mariprofundaceae bacterium]